MTESDGVLQGTHPSTHAEQASRTWRRGGMEGMEERGGMEALTSRREEERGGMAEGREGRREGGPYLLCGTRK